MRRQAFGRTVLTTALALLIGGCGGSSASAPRSDSSSGGTSNRVTVGTSAFAPANLTVPVNTTVSWTWDSCSNDPYYGQTCVSHSVTFDDASLGGSDVQSSGSYSKAFPSKGVYAYHCSVHGQAMAGTVTVQ